MFVEGPSRLCWLRGQGQHFNRPAIECDIPILSATSLILRPISKREIDFAFMGVSHSACSVVLIIGGILGQLCEPRTQPKLDYARMENVPKRTKDGLL
jgi:hypothetical protein